MEGLLITAGLTLFVANAFDLTSISTLGSAGFLLIFAAVNAANARHASTNEQPPLDFGGRGRRVSCGVGRVGLADGERPRPAKLWVLAAMIALAVMIEGSYRLTKREIRLHE